MSELLQRDSDTRASHRMATSAKHAAAPAQPASPDATEHPAWALMHGRADQPMPPVLPPGELVRQLTRMITQNAETEINPFLKLFYAGKVPIEGVRLWFKQWYLFARPFPSVVAQIIANAPVNYDVRQVFGANLHEELGELMPRGEHPLLLRRVGCALGMTEEEMEYAEPLPETLVCSEYRQKLVKDGTFVESVAAGALAIELTLPSWYRRVAVALQEQFGLSTDDLHFYWIHIGRSGVDGDYGGDAVHAAQAIEVLAKYATTADLQERCRQAVYRTIQYKRIYWWGIFREAVLKRDPRFADMIG